MHLLDGFDYLDKLEISTNGQIIDEQTRRSSFGLILAEKKKIQTDKREVSASFERPKKSIDECLNQQSPIFTKKKTDRERSNTPMPTSEDVEIPSYPLSPNIIIQNVNNVSFSSRNSPFSIDQTSRNAYEMKKNHSYNSDYEQLESMSKDHNPLESRNSSPNMNTSRCSTSSSGSFQLPKSIILITAIKIYISDD